MFHDLTLSGLAVGLTLFSMGMLWRAGRRR